jgi:STE24 endopeptidase
LNEDKSRRYHRLKRQGDMLERLWAAVLLAGLLATGLNRGLRDWVSLLANESATLSVALYAGSLLLMHEAGALPLAFLGGYRVERRYGLSAEPTAAWLRSQLKSVALGLVLSAGAASVVYACIRWSPERWWLPAGLLFAAASVGLTNLAPVLVLPLFYSVRPLSRESLRQRLLRLAERGGARVLGAYEWGLGGKTRKANAALAGLGATRRILVSDTMLLEYSEEEIEVVLAHEIAHHVHGDIWKGLLLESALALAGFYMAARVLQGVGGAVGLEGPSDLAGMPLLVLAAGIVSLAVLPLSRAISRRWERGADRFALELTRNPAAFISALRRLGAQNLAEERPSALVRWLFYSHPPIDERIAAAQAFEP